MIAAVKDKEKNAIAAKKLHKNFGTIANVFYICE